MRALVYLASTGLFGPGEKALEERPKPEILAATDAIIKLGDMGIQ